MGKSAKTAGAAKCPDCLRPQGSQLIIFGGKGGVGKTTCATATALYLAKQTPTSSFLLVSTDPAHSLLDSLAGLVPPTNLKILECDAQQCLLRFREQYGGNLRQIASRGTFLNESEINRFLELSLPGLDELMAFLEISAWVEKREYACIVVDTAPSGHTLRLLGMPQFLRKWLGMLESLLAKHRYMKWTFTRSEERDHLDAFLESLAGSLKGMETLLEDPDCSSLVLVMSAEAMSVRETESIAAEAACLKIPIREIVINKLYPVNECHVCREQRRLQARVLQDLFRHTMLPQFSLWGAPLRGEEVQGHAGLEDFWDWVRPIRQEPKLEGVASHAKFKVDGARSLPERETSLLILAGKGGVGKTTLACATALRLAKTALSRNVLLVSTGPSHSLSKCLNLQLSSQPGYVSPGLSAMEIDSQAEFETLKQQYAADIEGFFARLSGSMDLAFDREVIERILDLSPPGLDEVMGLTRVMTILASEQFDTVVLDSAATGHLIRLLELPDLIDQWLKVFFDLFLNYEQLFRLTEFSKELIVLSKNLKKLRRLLNDPRHCSLYAVSIPTDMAFEETRDLLSACRRLGVDVPALLLNLVTPFSECPLCSAINRRESLVLEKFAQCLPGKISVAYRYGEISGCQSLEKLGEALYPSVVVETEETYVH